MADLVITAASVVTGAPAKIRHAFAAATITAGQAVYFDASGLVALADADGASTLIREAKGIALNGGAVGQPIAVQTAGAITIGATMTAGVAYYASGTPGGICPVADVGSGEYPCIMGIATSTSVLDIKIQYAGVAL